MRANMNGYDRYLEDRCRERSGTRRPEVTEWDDTVLDFVITITRLEAERDRVRRVLGETIPAIEQYRVKR